VSVWSFLSIAAPAAMACACGFDRTGFADGDGGPADAAGLDAPLDAQGFDATAPPDPLEAGDVRLIFGVSGSNQLQDLRRAADRTWIAEPPTDMFAEVPWLVHRIGPDENATEFLMTADGSDGGPEIRVTRLVEGQWVVDWRVVHGLSVSLAARGFDLEFEQSGDALAVYGIGTDTPAYRIFTAGEWSVERIVPLNDGMPNPNPDTNAGLVRWVELERRPGTDEIAMVFADDRETLVAMVWNGDVWELDSGTDLEDRLKVNPVTSVVSNRVFDVAFEATSGDVVAAWGKQNSLGFLYSVFNATTRVWTPGTNIAALSGTPHYVDLASDPTTDQIVGGFYDLGDGTERLGVGVWNGLSWIDTFEIDSQITDVNDGAIGDFPGEVAFLHGTGYAICTYANDAPGQINYARWQPGFSWALQAPLSIVGMGQARSHDLVVLPGGNAALLVASDDASQLFSVVIDGDTGISLDDDPAPLTSGLADRPSTPFSVDVRAQ